MFDIDFELFGETIRNIFGCVCYFIVNCHGGVKCVFALLMLFRFVILLTMWSCRRLQLLCITPFGILCLSAIRIKFVNIILVLILVIGSYTKNANAAASI